jgi:hypothetical protein
VTGSGGVVSSGGGSVDDTAPFHSSVPPHQRAGYEAVYEVIRRFPGSAERNGVVWRAVEAYRAAAEAEIERRVREQVARQIEAECIDPEWPNDDVSRNGALAAQIARGDAR